MKLTRRAAMITGAVVSTVAAGCQSQDDESSGSSSDSNGSDTGPDTDPNGKENEDMTDRTPRHFNEDDELTSPIRLDDDDMVEYIDPETGDRIIEHEPSGETWRWRSDGTFVSDAIEAESASVERATNRFEYRIFERNDQIVAINDKGAVVQTGNFATTSTGGESQLGQVLQAVIDDHDRPTSIFLAPPESGEYWYIEQGVETTKALEMHGTTPMISDSGLDVGYGTTIVPDDNFNDDMFTFRGGDTGDIALSSKIKNLGIFGRPSSWASRSGRGIVLTDNLRDFYIEDVILYECPENWVELENFRGRFFSRNCMYEHAEQAGVQISDAGNVTYLSGNYFLQNQIGLRFDLNSNIRGVHSIGDYYWSNDGPAIRFGSTNGVFGFNCSSTFWENAQATQDAAVLGAANSGRGHFYSGCYFRGDPNNRPSWCLDYGGFGGDYVSVQNGLYAIADGTADLPTNSDDTTMLERDIGTS